MCTVSRFMHGLILDLLIGSTEMWFIEVISSMLPKPLYSSILNEKVCCWFHSFQVEDQLRDILKVFVFSIIEQCYE